MKRNIFNTTTTCEKVDLAGFADDLPDWLTQQMSNKTLTYLLAHAEGGVIWGRLDKGRLITSHDVAPQYSPQLRVELLQTARIFGPAGELFIWRDEMGEWTDRLITENALNISSEWTQAFDEQHIVWGTQADPKAHGFTLLREGSQGLVHVVPLEVTRQIDDQHRPLCLVVRHYVKAEESGFLRVDVSRLYNLVEK